MLDPAAIYIVFAGRSDDRRIDQRANLDHDRSGLELCGHRIEQRGIETMRDERPAVSNEGSALRCRLTAGETAEPAEGCPVIERLRQLHVRQVVPDRQQQRLEHCQRRPGEFALGGRIKRIEKNRDRLPIDQLADLIERRGSAPRIYETEPILTYRTMRRGTLSSSESP